MDIKTIKESLPYLMKANVSAMLVGAHGIGKTEGVRQFADENEYLLKIVNLGTQEVGDLVGLADFERDKEGRAIATKFMIPDWAKQISDYANKNPNSWAIIYLDEINRARRDVLQAVFPLILERRMHMLQFPKNVYVLAAMNPNTVDYNVIDISDKALLDRFCHIKVTPTKSEWFEYAKARNFDKDMVEFLKMQTDLLQEKGEDFNLSDIKPSRRSWESVNRLIQVKTPVSIFTHLASGLVGAAATTAYLKSLKTEEKPITGKEIVENFDKFKAKIKKFSSHKEESRTDLLTYSCDSLKEYVAEHDSKVKKDFTEEEGNNIIAFLLIIPRDLTFHVVRELYYSPYCRAFIEKSKELKEVLQSARGIPHEKTQA